MRLRSLLVLTSGLAAARQSAADPPPPADNHGDSPALLIATDSWTSSSRGDLVVDGGVIVGVPSALPTGLATGVAAGVQQGGALAVGARIAWSTATESTMAWQVTHDDLRLRATGALQHAIGRGIVGLRLGLGGTLVHESRVRHQGERAGLTGDDLKTSTWRMLPAADLDAVVQLAIAGPWRVVMSGGPSVVMLDGGAHASWTAQLGVAWQP